MSMISIQAEVRDGSENNVELRKEGFVPAVFYGPKEDSTPIKIKEGDFIKLYEEAGESTIISLKEGENEHESLIHDVQFDPITGKAIHVDFYVIEKGKKVEVSVPLNFLGVAPAEKNLGGVLVKVVHELPISALPKDLPSEIEVSLESLVDFDSQIKASDIKIGGGVELKVEPEEVIALVQEPKEEEEEPVEMDLDSIEVEEKGKKEEDSEESTEG
jgi:large subunit ribosomal protein L25